LTRGGEGLHEPLPDPFPGHLHEAEGGHFGDLVAGAVPAEAFHEPAQHEFAVGFQHHVDEVDDDDAADVAQAQLAHDLFGRLEVILRHRLLQGAPGSGVFAGVDGDDGHRLGTVDDEGPPRGQVHLAVSALGELLIDPVGGEHVLLLRPLGHAIGEVGGDGVTYSDSVFHAVSPEMTSSEKSSLKMSRTTRVASSGSPLTNTGEEAPFACFFSISAQDRKSTRLNSSHVSISYAVFCLKKKINITTRLR